MGVDYAILMSAIGLLALFLFAIYVIVKWTTNSKIAHLIADGLFKVSVMLYACYITLCVIGALTFILKGIQ
jgi:fumarate reductase subunit D